MPSSKSNVLTRSEFKKRENLQSSQKAESSLRAQQGQDEIHKKEEQKEHSQKTRSRSSTRSLILEKNRLIMEAELEKARVETEQIERTAELQKQMISKKLAADIAALNEEWRQESSKGTRNSVPAEHHANKTVEDWFEHNAHVTNFAPPPAHTLHDDDDAPTDMQHLVRALHHMATASSNVNNKLLSRLATSKDLPIYAGDPLEWLHFKKSYYHITRLIVERYHKMCNHGHNELVVNELRQRYWIVKLRPTVRNIASKCLYCRIKKSQPYVPLMGDLPMARLAHHQRPYTYCGVDLFGPIQVSIGRRRERRYGVLFTCLTVRCIHIELANSLTTDSFIMAFRRMAARRGWPSHMYSDNGTNLRGSCTELKRSFAELDHELIQQEMTNNRGVEWHFISPASPHMGGVWERLIRTVKTALKVVLKERVPKEEMLLTFLTEVENMVNSRPLTHVPVDPRTAEALTPNHFILGCSSNLPVPGRFDDLDLRPVSYCFQ